MATTTTSSSNSNEEANKTILLPDIWVTNHQIHSTGRRVVPYYLNVRTSQKFYSKAAFYKHFRRMGAQSESWLNRERAEEEKDHKCSRCKETGHNCLSCPYPIIHKTNPYEGMKIRRCSRCHSLGHDVRKCGVAVEN